MLVTSQAYPAKAKLFSISSATCKVLGRELYEATRGTWVLGANREDICFAMAVYDNVIQEVYEIYGWQSAGTTTYKTRDVSGEDSSKWEFIGSLCIDGQVRTAYIGKKVKHLFPHGFTDGFRNCWPDEM